MAGRKQRAWWFRPLWDVDAVALHLGIQASSVRRYLTDHSGFPEPAEQRGGRNYWTPAAVFRYLAATQSRGYERVPRLCPLADDLSPALFVGSDVARTRGSTYVVHTWEPSDDRGPVGVAYCVDFQRCHPDDASHLLSLRPDLTALALPSDIATIADGPDDAVQPKIAVADPAGTGWYPWQAGWLDLAALVQVDVPWWSRGLTDVEAMNAWRPGSPTAQLRPQVADFTGEHFRRCRPRDGSTADRALAALADATDTQLAFDLGLWPSGHDSFPNQPGLRHAAVAVVGAQPPTPATPEVISAALRHRISDHGLAVRAVQTGKTWEVLRAAITYELVVIDRDRCSRLAHEWCNRLVPADPGDRSEIGYHWVRWVVGCMDGQPPYRCWRDPLNVAVWAISSADGTVYATVGTRMPARGRVEEIAIEDRRTFFRDSAGNTFPLPFSDGTTYRTSGGSASDLTAAILALLDDAGKDVYRCHLDVDILDTQATGLYETILAATDTVTLSRDDLERLREETPTGIARREDMLARLARQRRP